MSKETYLICIFALGVLICVLLGYIIYSTLIAIGIYCHSMEIEEAAYIYCLLCNIDFKHAITNKDTRSKFLLNGLAYSMLYITFSIRLRLSFGNNYKQLVLGAFDNCIDTVMRMRNKEEQTKNEQA